MNGELRINKLLGFCLRNMMFYQLYFELRFVLSVLFVVSDVYISFYVIS